MGDRSYYIDALVYDVKAYEIAINSTGSTQESMPTNGKRGLGDGKDTITAYRIERNASVTVDYTDLKNSSYNGEPLSKVSMTISIDPSSQNISEYGVFAFGQNPSSGFNVNFRRNSVGGGNYALKFNVTMKFYDSKGNLINLTDENNALLGMSSFNSTDKPIGTLEGFVPGQGTSVIDITGSSIRNQNGKYYSIKPENTREQFGQKNIDHRDNPYFWYLGSVLKMTGTSPTFQVFASSPSYVGRPETFNTYLPGLWMTATSELATTVAIKPAPPTPPTRKSVDDAQLPSEPVKIAEASLVITKHIDITTGKELHQQEEGTKPKRSFDGYEFVETKTKDGNTIHYYKPIDKTPIKPIEDKPKEDKAITKHFDITTGKEIAPQEDGNQPKKDIPNYEFVETKTKTGETDHYYKPISKPITRHIDKDTGKDIVPPEDGNKPKKDIPGYRFVETKDKDGNTYHYYQKVHTRHYDITTGKELLPQEDGTQPKKDIPNYEFVETKDKDGDTEHFYKPVKKVYTKHIDKKTGKELVPQEDGKQPKKDIPGYRFVETKDEDGNTIHYYEKVITKHLEVGTNKELAPQEDGQQPKKDIEGYEFVETKDDNGDTIHFYKPVKKVYTKHIDKSTGKELAPQEDGKQPKRDFDGYKFVETKDEDGNTIHYYEPIAKVITKHIDIDTNEEIAPQEDGKQPKKDINGYEFVETKDDNGNTLHYYRKVKKQAAIKGKTPAKYADTNEAAGIVQSVIGALGLTSLAGFGFWKKRKK